LVILCKKTSQVKIPCKTTTFVALKLNNWETFSAPAKSGELEKQVIFTEKTNSAWASG